MNKKSTAFQLVGGLALALALLFPLRAGAETTVGLGYSVGVSPYRDYDAQGRFFPSIRFENEHIYIQDLSLGLKLHEAGPLKLSVFVAYDPTSFDRDDADDWRMRRLDDRREGIMLGGRADWSSAVGLFRLSAAGDVSGHSQGFLWRASFSKSFELDPLTLTPQIGLMWASDDYNNYYYGVSSHESSRTGLRAYEADAAFSPFAGLAASLPLDSARRWRLFAHGEVQALPSEIKDSPMVDRSTTYRLSTGLNYTF